MNAAGSITKRRNIALLGLLLLLFLLGVVIDGTWAAARSVGRRLPEALVGDEHRREDRRDGEDREDRRNRPAQENPRHGLNSHRAGARLQRVQGLRGRSVVLPPATVGAATHRKAAYAPKIRFTSWRPATRASMSASVV